MSEESLRIILNSPVVSINENSSVICYNLDLLDRKLDELKDNFPAGTLHAVAIKANPLTSVLEKIKDRGFGLEAASLPELHLALGTGIETEKIVFDSPAKTWEEIEFAVEKGIYINADSFAELERIDSIVKKHGKNYRAGIRINPVVGAGSIASTSVAGKFSKFGIPLDDHRKELADAFGRYIWLRGVHLHIGSQGMPVDMLVAGVKKVFDFAEDVNSNCFKKGAGRPISIFDIGGGLGVSYQPSDMRPGMDEYIKKLKKEVSGLFTKGYRLITEFGRYINAGAAVAVSRIEYLKKEKDYNVLIIHLGADFLLRRCYNPDDWHHEISLLRMVNNTNLNKPTAKYYIAGPLCFAGDIIARDLELPEASEGDYIVIHDVGAYTLSMWSRYNSRQIPLVIGYRNEGDKIEILRKRERPEDLVAFWSPGAR